MSDPVSHKDAAEKWLEHVEKRVNADLNSDWADKPSNDVLLRLAEVHTALAEIESRESYRLADDGDSEWDGAHECGAGCMGNAADEHGSPSFAKGSLVLTNPAVLVPCTITLLNRFYEPVADPVRFAAAMTVDGSVVTYTNTDEVVIGPIRGPDRDVLIEAATVIDDDGNVLYDGEISSRQFGVAKTGQTVSYQKGQWAVRSEKDQG